MAAAPPGTPEAGRSRSGGSSSGERPSAAAAWFEKRYLTIDDRTLAVVRIALGLLLLTDLAKRAAGLDVWYVDQGLLPRALAETHNPGSWSFFWLLGSRAEVIAGFVFCAICYTALTLGFLTPLAHAASLVCACSLQHRIQLLAMGADAVMVLTLWWTLLLPLGRRFSLDARLRQPRNLRGSGMTVSVAVLGMNLQLAGIYFFNAAHKSGPTWTEGSAVNYVLWLDRVATPFAVWLRGVLPAIGSQILTWGTRGIEALLPVLILSPIFSRWTRRSALLSILSLHVGIAMCMNVGLFSPAMVVLSLVLVSYEDWNLLARRFPRLAALLGDRAPQRGLERAMLWGREALVTGLIWVLVTQLLIDNAAASRHVRLGRSEAQAFVVRQARLSQSWTMFSPDAGRGEMTLIVDAVTEGGRRIDPYNLVGAHVADPSIREIPSAIGYDLNWHSYTRLVPGRPDLHFALRRWILSHHERTGQKEDRIVLFWVIELTRGNPPPGERVPWPSAQRIIMGGAR